MNVTGLEPAQGLPPDPKFFLISFIAFYIMLCSTIKTSKYLDKSRLSAKFIKKAIKIIDFSKTQMLEKC